MNTTGKWYFPTNNYGMSNGLDTADMEIFKKDPDGSLAREICQNSIDARTNYDGIGSAKVIFKTFLVSTSNIPGVELLKEEISKCLAYSRSGARKDIDAFEKMQELLKSDSIKCLRISDFNTMGLRGIKTGKRGTPFFNLTRGASNCNKGAGNGGSKGIGKFASFVVSGLNTVFYSTVVSADEYGYIGVTKLSSRPLSMDSYIVDEYDIENDDKDDGESTQGNGYFASSEKHTAVFEHLNLDKDFIRNEERGTDVYILGYDDSDDWKTRIIGKVLDSFMGAFLLDGFEVVVEDVTINKDSIENIINDSIFKDLWSEDLYNSIRSQYELLKNGLDELEEKEIEGCGTIRLGLLRYDKSNRNLSTKKCDFIRYPYMKIKSYRKQSVLDYSAICVIGNNCLNEFLRSIENPEHTDWQIERLKNDKALYKKGNKTIKVIREVVARYIEEKLIDGFGEQTDATVANDILPDLSTKSGDGNMVKEKQVVRKIKINNTGERVTSRSKQKGSLEVMEGGREISQGIKNNNRRNKKKKSKINQRNVTHANARAKNNGNGIYLEKMKCRHIYNENKGMYDIVFTSLYDVNRADIYVTECGNSSDTYDVDIVDAYVNGNKCKVRNGVIAGIKLEKNKNYKISYIPVELRRFAAEVRIYAIQE
ncbi:hypothetical protein [uncultured Veillonella sp.]|uniref:hypothetical protein n=1 Tax=uncultured Veillonella sp. TaxID=159268 RepID=UPI002622E4BC|nr:hypothetical protein [uncultured Veillonella sp.]